MSSTPNTVRRLALAAAAVTIGWVSTGCMTAREPEVEPGSATPIPTDEAMQRRDWPRSEAGWANGDVAAGATRFPYAPQTESEGAGRALLGPERSNAALDTAYFVVQTLVLPFTYITD